VIGVNSQIATSGGGGGNVGIGFAVPANTARTVVPQLAAGRTVERPWLGVETTQPPGGAGALVDEVVPGSPAERAGVRAGDIIVGVGDTPVDDPQDVADAVKDREPGEDLDVRVRRGTGEQELDVTLGVRPPGTP
jgi:putative serine protease PepD